MMRTIVDLQKKQIEALASFCRQHKISRAEAVRRAVDKLLKDSSAGGKETGFGLWKNKGIKSRQFIESLRSEWEQR